MPQTKHIPEEREETTSVTNLPRRNFLTKVFGAAALTAGAASCTKSLTGATDVSAAAFDKGSNTLTAGSLNMGNSDYAVLNYAYLLEQLEAQFYTTVTAGYYSGASDWEKTRLAQIRDHEVAHREFFKTALGSYAIPEIMFDLSSVDFTSRTSVLGTARTFEDLGVSAYNGAAKYIKNPDYLTVAGKIVSVEARHAAYIRDLLQPNSFADATVVNGMGLDLVNNPETVLKAVIPFLPFTVNTSKAPWNR